MSELGAGQRVTVKARNGRMVRGQIGHITTTNGKREAYVMWLSKNGTQIGRYYPLDWCKGEDCKGGEG